MHRCLARAKTVSLTKYNIARVAAVCLSQVKLLLDRFDEDGNGQLDVDEFVGFYAEAKAMYELVAFSV